MCAAWLTPVFAQTQAQGAFNAEQYKKALWMVTRMYGGQRSGVGPNWLIMEHTNPAYRTSFTQDADAGRNLEGGWFDCGDHVTFGHTFYYSAYMLAKAYDVFPTGFHDLYHGKDYSDYMESKDWSIAGGSPNGMPDLLEELKYATDWIIKATPDANTFYYEKGNGDYDHKKWVTAGYMSTLPVNEGGEPRPIYKNPNDGHMASLAAATMAVMSRIYRKYDPDYADLCLAHAKNAYGYAKPRKSQAAGAASGSFYGAAKHPVTTFVLAASEMFITTNDNTYKGDIVFTNDDQKNHGWALDYVNPHDLAIYAVSMALPDERDSNLSFMRTTFIDKYKNSVNSEKVSTVGGDWGALRYPANFAFAAGLYSKAANSTDFDQFIYNQVDYILGANTAKQSFVVGFCENCTKVASKPHHRNVFLNDQNVENKNGLTIPERNKYFGYLVGGTRASNSYVDDVENYQTTEGGLDYSAGLVGALAYVVSKLAPADTSKFGGGGTQSSMKIRISTSPDPNDASRFVSDTVSSSYPNFYAHVFNDDGTAFDISNLCGNVTWKIDGEVYSTGCAFTDTLARCAAIGCKRYTLTAEFYAKSTDRLPITASVFATDELVSVRYKAASLARNGYAISIRPSAVVFTAAEGRKITKLSVLNLKGRKIFGKVGAYSEIKWDSASRPKGMYVVKMTMSNGAVVQRNLLLK
jgi:hypothetical protein